jgi:tRNA threonylcarbamoyladenosine biosynthesis protein TsaE
MTATLMIDIADEDETDALGRCLAEILPAGAVVALIGPLGAGKTRLVRSICSAAGVEDGVVASPTFVLVHEYECRLPICHFDAYRLRNEQEFQALGPDEYFSSDGWSFVEWADRVRDCLPAEYLKISIQPTGEQSRTLEFRAIGAAYMPLLDALKTLSKNESEGDRN